MYSNGVPSREFQVVRPKMESDASSVNREGMDAVGGRS